MNERGRGQVIEQIMMLREVSRERAEDILDEIEQEADNDQEVLKEVWS